jgi:hypothetical protein
VVMITFYRRETVSFFLHLEKEFFEKLVSPGREAARLSPSGGVSLTSFFVN